MKFKDYFEQNKCQKKYQLYRELANKLGISTSMVALLVTGKRKPGRVLTKKIESVTNGAVTFYDW